MRLLSAEYFIKIQRCDDSYWTHENNFILMALSFFSISMELDFTATTTEGDPSDEIVNGILNMKDSGYFGVLPIKSVTILGMPFISSFHSDIMNMVCKSSEHLSCKLLGAGYLHEV